MPFVKGKSGNPRGRKPGIIDKRLELRDRLKSHAPELIDTAVQMALKGDTTALRLCLERILPALRPESEAVEIPAAGSLSELGEAIIKATLAGNLSPTAAQELMGVLSGHARVLEVLELERRIAEIERDGVKT